MELLHEVDNKHLVDIKNSLKKYLPKAIKVYGSIILALEGKLPNVKFYSYGDPEACKFLIIIPSEPSPLNSEAINTTFFAQNEEDLDQILKTTQYIDWSQQIIFSVPQDYVPAISKQIASVSGREEMAVKIGVYILEDKEKLLTSLPADVAYTSLNLEDLRTVLKHWEYGDGSSIILDRFTFTIQNCLSVGLWSKKNNKLISWAVEEPYGAIGNIHTLENYRRKGYGKAAASYLSSKLLDENKIPFCFIEKSNATSICLFESIGFKLKYEAVYLKYYPKNFIVQTK